MTLTSRKSAQWVCGMGLLQLLFATGLTVCGFIVLGLFNHLSCIGIWCGFPMMVPGILSIIVLGTRKRFWSILTILTNLIVCAVAAYHMFVIYNETDYWEKYRKLAESTSRVCYDRLDQCACDDNAYYMSAGYRVQFCNQFRVGEELFWTMMGLTVGGALFSLFGVFMAIWASCTKANEKAVA